MKPLPGHPGQRPAVDLVCPAALRIVSRLVGADPDRRADLRGEADHPGVGVVRRSPGQLLGAGLRRRLAAVVQRVLRGRRDRLHRVRDVVGDLGVDRLRGLCPRSGRRPCRWCRRPWPRSAPGAACRRWRTRRSPAPGRSCAPRTGRSRCRPGWCRPSPAGSGLAVGPLGRDAHLVRGLGDVGRAGVDAHPVEDRVDRPAHRVHHRAGLALARPRSCATLVPLERLRRRAVVRLVDADLLVVRGLRLQRLLQRGRQHVRLEGEPGCRQACA